MNRRSPEVGRAPRKIFKIKILGNGISGILTPGQCAMMTDFFYLRDSTEIFHRSPPPPNPPRSPQGNDWLTPLILHRLFLAG